MVKGLARCSITLKAPFHHPNVGHIDVFMFRRTSVIDPFTLEIMFGEVCPEREMSALWNIG